LATGGAVNTGGSLATGGAVNTGGSLATGGAVNSSSATGGTSAAQSQDTGGAGGRSSSGGTVTNGGATTTGGSSGSAGSSTTGGNTSTCGMPLAGVDSTNPLNPKYFWVDESCYPTPKATAGFIDLEPRNYTYTNNWLARVTGTTTATRMFYSFIPALTNAKARPLFVFFDGGPSVATTGRLFTYGTGPMTLKASLSGFDSVPKANPNNWANLGNLLYIDARQAGISYGVAADPTDESQRSAGFTPDNFNLFSDAADVLRVILRVVKAQPALQNNPVVLVGASYGALRASMILKMALDPVAVGDSQQPDFVDSALSEELQTHFATVFQNEGNVPLTRARVARQFGWQVLNEPAINYADQNAIQCATQCDPSYISTQRLQQMGLSCPLQDQDSEAAGILDDNDVIANTMTALMNPASLGQLLGGVDPTTISGLSSATRPGAYRLIDDNSFYPKAPTSWTNTQGTAAPFDRFYIEWNFNAYYLFGIEPPVTPLTNVGGFYFLQNLLDVHTFITRAALDFTIIPEVIPLSFMALNDTMQVLTDVSIVDSLPAGTERPGEMVFTYDDVPAFGVTAGTYRAVRFPTYLTASHSVTLYQPAEFYADVSDFLAGVLPPMPE
jgi:hypothetical protein